MSNRLTNKTFYCWYLILSIEALPMINTRPNSPKFFIGIIFFYCSSWMQYWLRHVLGWLLVIVVNIKAHIPYIIAISSAQLEAENTLFLISSPSSTLLFWFYECIGSTSASSSLSQMKFCSTFPSCSTLAHLFTAWISTSSVLSW